MIRELKYGAALSLGALLLGAGCGSPRYAALPAPRPLGAEYLSVTAVSGDGSDDSASPRESSGPLGLKAALVLALMHNPEFAAASLDVRAAEAQALQAGAGPNPKLELGVGEFDRGGEGIDSSEMEVMLGQVIELGGKRRRRSRMAEAKGKLAGWDYERKRLDVLTSTAQRFVAVIVAQRRMALAASTVELTEGTSHAVAERVKAGKEPPMQGSKAAAGLEMARMDALEAEGELRVARKRLAAMWASEEPQFEGAEADLGSVLVEIPSFDRLRDHLSGNPDLARGDAEVRLRAAALASERAARVPDLSVRLGLEHYEEDGTDALAFGVGIPLPLFDRNQGGVNAARHKLAKAEIERRAAEVRLATALAEAHAGLASAHRRVLTLRSKVVPAMQEAFDASHEGYRQGKFGFLDMLDAQRGLFESKSALLSAQSDYHIAVAEIEGIICTDLEGLMKDR